jgi:hypothetical protein
MRHTCREEIVNYICNLDPALRLVLRRRKAPDGTGGCLPDVSRSRTGLDIALKFGDVVACVDFRTPLHFGSLHTATMIIALKPRTSKVLVGTGARGCLCKGICVDSVSAGDDGAHVAAHCVSYDSVAHDGDFVCNSVLVDNLAFADDFVVSVMSKSWIKLHAAFLEAWLRVRYILDTKVLVGITSEWCSDSSLSMYLGQDICR